MTRDELVARRRALTAALTLLTDLTPELREVLRSNHRIAEAEAAVAKAEGTL